MLQSSPWAVLLTSCSSVSYLHCYVHTTFSIQCSSSHLPTLKKKTVAPEFLRSRRHSRIVEVCVPSTHLPIVSTSVASFLRKDQVIVNSVVFRWWTVGDVSGHMFAIHSIWYGLNMLFLMCMCVLTNWGGFRDLSLYVLYQSFHACLLAHWPASLSKPCKCWAIEW